MPTTTDSPVDTLLAATTLFGTSATLLHAAARATDLVIQSNNTRRIREINGEYTGYLTHQHACTASLVAI